MSVTSNSIGAHDPAEQPASVHLERLSLRVAGLDEVGAVVLARLVAERLAPGLLRAPGVAGLDSLSIELPADGAAGATPDQLAGRIVDQIGRVLARDWAGASPTGVAP